MSLPRDYPFIRVGDRLNQFQAWRLDSNDPTRTLDDDNTDRGRLFVQSRSTFPTYPPFATSPPAGSGTPDAGQSSLSVDRPTPNPVPADSVAPVLVTATVRDAAGEGLPGFLVQFSTVASGITFDPPNPNALPLGVSGWGVTDEDGIARVTVYGTVAGSAAIVATVDPLGTPVVIAASPTILFVAAAIPSGIVTVVLYRDFDYTQPVALGRGPAAARMQVRERLGSKITGSVYLADGTLGSSIQLYVSLASTKDAKGREDRVVEFKTEDPLERADFEDIQRSVLRQFYLRLFAIYPPQSCYGNPMSFGAWAEMQQAGYYGQVDPTTVALWSLNVENDYELTGLQNPGDFREWATIMFLRLAWERRIRGGDLDEAQQRVKVLAREEDAAFKLTRPMVDVMQDGRPDRIAEKTGALRFRRG